MASRVWKDGTRRGIVYVEGREAAEQVMQATGRVAPPAPVKTRTRRAGHVAGGPGPEETAMNGAMAVYLDRKGKPFAWQIPFDIGHWDRVAALVDAE
jgi:hypothetical protein